LLRDGRTDVWDSGRVDTDDSVAIPYGGPALRPRQRYHWTVQVWDELGDRSELVQDAWWEMALPATDTWHGAEWISPDGQLEHPGITAPTLRTEFTTRGTVVSARAYVHGLGFYELRLNGKKVGDRVLTPASTPYDRRILYDTYDVTELIRGGDNAVGLWLGNGYGSRFSRYGFRWLGPLQAVLLLALQFADGTEQIVRTNDAWRWYGGPITSNDLYDGESYDARLEQTGWDSPGFDADHWLPVRTVPPPDGTPAAATAPTIRVTQSIRPIALTEPTPGVWIFDLGQNIAGWARLRVRGPAGTTVRMRTAEELDSDGALDVTTNRDADALDSYTLSGDPGGETYEPRFTYHGFRYVEVTGHPGPPTLDTLTGRAIHADVADTGTFTSSDELLNRIWRNNRWSILNNSLSLPTDTPVRDERTPPAMDVQTYHEASIIEFGMDRFYAKYLRDLPPGTALPSDDAKGQQPDMAGGQVVLAWSLYEQYGDRSILDELYPAMKAFVERNAAEVPGHIWPEDRAFGDWCPPDHGPESNGGLGSATAGECFSEGSLVNTALAYRQACAVAQAAGVVGTPADVKHYGDLAAAIRAAFNAEFLQADGWTYGSGRQVTSILPLAFGMVPAANSDAVGNQLVERILGADDGHLDTGIFGTRYLLDALAAIGRVDVALTVLGQTTYPGFGFQIAHGATTTWEQWSYRAGMQTHDHAMFAGINASLYTVLAGIRPTSAGYRTVTIAPQLPDALTHVTASIDTVRGRITSTWTRTDNGLVLTVDIPVNVTATIAIPTPLQPTTHTVTAGHWTFHTP
jgi:alpha-L-rhamnosidase